MDARVSQLPSWTPLTCSLDPCIHLKNFLYDGDTDNLPLQPFRPRGAENIKPSLHQRHKSTGNLANGASNPSTAGFRGPAKRAAFGDVTNMAKQTVGGREGAKVHKVQSVAHFDQAKLPSNLNKENVHAGKDALSRPPQKLTTISSKPAPAPLDNRTNEPPKRSERIVTRDSAVAHAAPVPKKVQVQADRRSTSSQQEGYLDAPPLQPRHHKSQPQLKQQQPSLRRTQSRQLEKIEAVEEPKNVSDDNIDLVAMPYLDDDVITLDEAYADAQEVHLGCGVPTHLDHEAELGLHSKLPEIEEEPALVPVNYRDGPTPGLSEPEEYWDVEDEEDYENYEEQDEAYTTAQSWRSRDMTTGGVTSMLLPRVTSRVQRELDEARLEVMQTRPAEDIEEEAWDVSMVAEYGDEIFEYLREMEVSYALFSLTAYHILTIVSTDQDASQPTLHGIPD